MLTHFRDCSLWAWSGPLFVSWMQIEVELIIKNERFAEFRIALRRVVSNDDILFYAFKCWEVVLIWNESLYIFQENPPIQLRIMFHVLLACSYVHHCFAVNAKNQANIGWGFNDLSAKGNLSYGRIVGVGNSILNDQFPSRLALSPFQLARLILDRPLSM